MTQEKSYLGNRTLYIGASDAPALQGISPYTSYDLLIATKSGLYKNIITDRFYVDRGNEYEDKIIPELEQERNVKIESQTEFIHKDSRSKCHLDGFYFDNNVCNFIEVKSKTIKKDENLGDLIEEITKNPPAEYLAQMQMQYALIYNNFVEKGGPIPPIKAELIVGLFKNRSLTCDATVYVDVTEKVVVNPESVFNKCKQFWEKVDNTNYILDAQTRNTIKKQQLAVVVDQLELKDIESKEENLNSLLKEYEDFKIKYDKANDDMKLYKKQLADSTKKVLEYAGDDINSIKCGPRTVKFNRKVSSGRYTPAKPESLVEASIKIDIEVINEW